VPRDADSGPGSDPLGATGSMKKPDEERLAWLRGRGVELGDSSLVSRDGDRGVTLSCVRRVVVGQRGSSSERGVSREVSRELSEAVRELGTRLVLDPLVPPDVGRPGVKG